MPAVPLRTLAPAYLGLWLAIATRALGQAGSLDPSFDPGTGVSHNGLARVASIALQSDGKVVIGGDFTTVNSVSRPRVARLNPDGSLDAQFNPGAGPNAEVFSVLAQPDCKVLIAGAFTQVAGVARSAIARLNADGTLDTGFAPQPGPNFDVTSMRLQPNGNILIGGPFDKVDGVNRSSIARLTNNGALDRSFNPGTGANDSVQSIDLQPDGKVLIGGFFTVVNHVALPGIARLNADGSVDRGFDPGTGTDAEIDSLIVQPDGKVLIAGAFINVAGTARNRIARLNANGSLDLGFDPGSGANSDVLALALQDNGKILAGGNFSQFNGMARNSLARLNPNGSLDNDYIPGLGDDTSAQSLALQPDARLLVGGYMSSVNGVSRKGIARLLGDTGVCDDNDPCTTDTVDPVLGCVHTPINCDDNDPDTTDTCEPATGCIHTPIAPAPRLFNAALAGDVFTVSVATVSGKDYVLQFKDALTESTWNELPSVRGDGTVKTLTDAAASAAQRFYRARVR